MHSDIPSTKTALRQRLKQARLELHDGARTIMSRKIVDRLKLLIDWKTIKHVHYFEPMHELLEPDISELIVYLEDTYPHIALYAPRLIAGEWQMVSIRDEAPPPEFDVILVPMFGFDDKLHRIGYGGGYYDRFLATQPRAKKIGVCFEQGHLDHFIPVEAHDISLDMIITESTP